MSGRPAWQIVAALVIGLVVAGAPAAYFYSQNSALQSKQATLNSQISSLQSSEAAIEANITALTTQRAELEANITALTTQKAGLSANVTASEQQIQQLDSQIASLNSGLNTLQTEFTNAENQIVIDEGQIVSLQSHENLSAIQILYQGKQSWSSTPGITVGLYAGPLKVTDFAGYLNFTFANLTPGTAVTVSVQWDGEGVHYSSSQTLASDGSITFPVLLTKNLNYSVGFSGSGSAYETDAWYA